MQQISTKKYDEYLFSDQGDLKIDRKVHEVKEKMYYFFCMISWLIKNRLVSLVMK